MSDSKLQRDCRLHVERQLVSVERSLAGVSPTASEATRSSLKRELAELREAQGRERCGLVTCGSCNRPPEIERTTPAT